jgi:hypothetical protein
MNRKVKRSNNPFHYFLLLISLVLLLTGCTTAAKPQHYYPKAGNPPWVFAGSLHGTSGEIIISVDNIVVLQGRVPSFKESLQLAGMYRDSKLIANCSMQYCSGGMQCMVYVETKPAVLLDFSGL